MKKNNLRYFIPKGSWMNHKMVVSDYEGLRSWAYRKNGSLEEIPFYTGADIFLHGVKIVEISKEEAALI